MSPGSRTLDLAAFGVMDRPKQRPGSRFGRMVGPLLFVALMGSVGLGGWKLIQSTQQQSTKTDEEQAGGAGEAAATSTAPAAGPADATSPAGETIPVVGMETLTPYPGTAAIVPTFRSVTLRTSLIGIGPSGQTVGSDGEVRLDLDDQVGELRDTTFADEGGPVVMFDPEYMYEPGAAFGAPWTRQAAPTRWFADGATLIGLDRLVAVLGLAATTPSATTETLNGHEVTSYHSTITLQGPGLELLPGAIEQFGIDAQLEGVQLVLSADADGVVIATEVDARAAVHDALGGAQPADLVMVFTRQEIVSWSSEPLGLALPTDWVDA